MPKEKVTKIGGSDFEVRRSQVDGTYYAYCPYTHKTTRGYHDTPDEVLKAFDKEYPKEKGK